MTSPTAPIDLAVPGGIVSAVLANDPYRLRFEAFVVELLSTEEGVTFLETSRTYDRGRDARSIQGHSGAQHVLAITTARNLDDKVVTDARRLAATTKLASVTYCTSGELSESALDALEKAIRAELPADVSIRMLGLVQLKSLATKHPRVLAKHYGSEIEDLKRALLYDEQQDTPVSAGMRLALSLFGGDDAVELREEICKRLVLESLLDGKPRTFNGIASLLSGRLHLPRSVSQSFLEPILAKLVALGHLARPDAAAYVITAAGREVVAQVEESSAARFIEGKKVVHKAMEDLLGYRLAAQDFERFWAVFSDSLAEMFHLHGASIAAMVRSLQTGEDSADDVAYKLARGRLADRAAQVFPNVEQHDEVHQAVEDLFSQKGTAVFEWLSSVCAVYVMMCAIGLESTSADEVERALRGVTLLPDTDIVLSLLCEGEENHNEVRRVLAAWRALGGDLRVPPPVLQEAAYHAWIADTEYVAVRHLLPTTSRDRSKLVLTNTFVRTFHQFGRNLLSPTEWRDYIDQYRGATRFDDSMLVEVLGADYGVEPLGEAAAPGDIRSDPDYASIRLDLLEQAAEETGRETDSLDERTQDKVRRDVELLVTVKVLRARLRQAANLRTVVVVSSARPLRRATAKFARLFGQPTPVLSGAAVAALLALTPGVRVGLQGLKALLFDVRLARRLQPIEVFAFRLLEQSQQFTLLPARRVTFVRRFRERLLEEAERRGRPARDIERDILCGADTEAAVAVIRDTLDKMAMPPLAEETIRSQERHISELKEEVARLRAELS